MDAEEYARRYIAPVEDLCKESRYTTTIRTRLGALDTWLSFALFYDTAYSRYIKQMPMGLDHKDHFNILADCFQTLKYTLPPPTPFKTFWLNLKLLIKNVWRKFCPNLKEIVKR